MQHIASHHHHTQCHLLGPVGLFVFQHKQQISPFLFSAFSHMPLPCVSEQGMYINEANQKHTHSHIGLGNLHQRQTQVDSYSWLDVSSGRRGLIFSSEASWFRPHFPFFEVLVSILDRLITVSVHCFPNKVELVGTSLPPYCAIMSVNVWMQTLNGKNFKWKQNICQSKIWTSAKTTIWILQVCLGSNFK